MISLKKESDSIKEEIEDVEKDMRKTRKKDRLADLENDIFLREAINITSDYIGLLK